jgi:hypothetical protein
MAPTCWHTIMLKTALVHLNTVFESLAPSTATLVHLSCKLDTYVERHNLGARVERPPENLSLRARIHGVPQSDSI